MVKAFLVETRSSFLVVIFLIDDFTEFNLCANIAIRVGPERAGSCSLKRYEHCRNTWSRLLKMSGRPACNVGQQSVICLEGLAMNRG